LPTPSAAKRRIGVSPIEISQHAFGHWLSPGDSKPATYGRFKTSHPEARSSYHFFMLVQEFNARPAARLTTPGSWFIAVVV
jgi:hypothetical protein